MPQGKVFVRTARDEGQPLSVVASHELVEMLVDPGLNLLSTGPDAGTVYAYEVADPVQAVKFAVHGLPMSDFVYPAYFEGFRPAGSAAFDHVRAVTTPFEILPGGYQNAMTNGGWTQLFGADDARGRSALTSVRGRRSERRALVTLQRADAQAIARAA